jgi:hypothetical protein
MSKCKRYEEHGGTVVPVPDELEWVPENLTVDILSARVVSVVQRVDK